MLLTGVASASTVTLSTGFGSGITVTEGGAANDGIVVAVGGWDGATFTQLGTATIGTLSGNLVGTSPGSLTGQTIFVFVGSEATIGDSISSGTYVILQSPETFLDVTNTLNTNIVAAENSGNLPIAFNSSGLSSYTSPTTLDLNAVPEPSIALLGALGVIGLARRRRR